MKFIKITITIAFINIVMAFQPAFGQVFTVSEGNKNFKNLAYVDAIKVYQQVANKGYASEDLFKNLGDAHYFTADYTNAAKWYAKLFGLSAIQSNEYSFRYGHSLRALREYEQADKYLKKYYEAKGYNYIDSESFLKELKAKKQQFLIQSTAYGSEFSDYPAYLKNDSLYVVSGNASGVITSWTKEPSSDVFSFSNGNLTEVPGEVNTKYNEGSMVITNDGKTMYFTRNNYTNKKLRKDASKTIRLKLYKATKVDSTWQNIEELPFNSDNYSVGHPALSKDESFLYFVSDMPNNGNKGGTDLFKVERLEDNTYGAVHNMAAFNTLGNEMFPFVANNGSLYFSSNGHAVNLGGLDVYEAAYLEDGSYGSVKNVGQPVNSTMDDFAFLYNNNSKTGYFATNRDGYQNDDVIAVSFNDTYEAPCVINLAGTVRDSKTDDLLGTSLITLIDHENKVIEYITVSDAGSFSLNELDCKAIKSIRAEKKGYVSNEIDLLNTSGTVDIKLNPREIKIEKGTDLGKLLNPIYFDLNKFTVKPESEVEMQKIIVLLNANPKLKIDVRSHTDSRSSDDYNVKLSNQRAQATINYLVSQGINRNRITGKGYGETRLVNGCSNGVNCSEEEHQRNRRSEFIVVDN